LILTPPVSVSAELAATLMLYSSMLPSVKTIADESGRVHADVDMPSRSIRWSCWRPPWIASVMKL
jgi:hypothetical protein